MFPLLEGLRIDLDPDSGALVCAELGEFLPDTNGIDWIGEFLTG